MLTYDELNAMLKTRPTKKLANNTYLRREGDNLVIRLHATDILTYSPDGCITYDTGGWMTNTTKDRFNKYGPVHIYQVNWSWYFDMEDGSFYEYQDGMTLQPNDPWQERSAA